MSQTPEQRRARYAKFSKAGRQAGYRRTLVGVGLAAGRKYDPRDGRIVSSDEFRPQRAHINITPAAWKTAQQHVGDCEYLEDGLDDVLVRALHGRVVYAQNACCHREPPFQDVTTELIAAAYTKSKAKTTGSSTARKVKMKEQKFTTRQLQVIYLIAAGCTYDEIAQKLGISPRTAKMHCELLRFRLDVNHKRQIPYAYKLATGKDPLEPGVLGPVPEPAPEPEPAPVADEAREGGFLTDVVGRMFDE